MAASVADQGVASSTNFVLNILLARWLVVGDYGAYSVSFSVLIVLAAFHNALILEPMTVVGPSEFQGRLNAYFRANNQLNWFVAVALAVVALIVALVYQNAIVRSCLFVMAMCLPGYVLLLTARRKQYVLNTPIRAFQISLLYGTLVFGAIYWLRASGRLTAISSVAVVGLSWCALFFLRAQSEGEPVSLTEISREHWRYGRWVFASALLAIGAADLQTLLLSMLVDLKAAGALRALMNFVLPLSQLLTVLSVYALPRLSSRAKMWGSHQLLFKGIWFSLALVGLSFAYLAAIVLFAPQLEHLLYAGKMATDVTWMPLLALSAFVAGVGASFSTLLRAIQNSQHIFIAGVCSTVVGFCCALLWQRNLGIGGAVWSLLAANTASTLVILSTYIWFLRRRNA